MQILSNCDKIEISRNFFGRADFRRKFPLSAIEKDSSIGTYIYMAKILQADFLETGFSQ